MEQTPCREAAPSLQERRGGFPETTPLEGPRWGRGAGRHTDRVTEQGASTAHGAQGEDGRGNLSSMGLEKAWQVYVSKELGLQVPCDYQLVFIRRVIAWDPLLGCVLM